MPRPYRQKRRAEQQAQTRQRIVEAAVDLHGSIGPAATTVSAIAERAGVQRVTVYKHFPDEGAILTACTAHWQAQHPLPDLAAILSETTTSEERLRTVLVALYTWYDENEQMLANVLRDLPQTPQLAISVAPLWAWLDGLRDQLAAQWEPSPYRRAAIGHALAFTTWFSLVRNQGLTTKEAVGLMVALARGPHDPVSAAVLDPSTRA